MQVGPRVGTDWVITSGLKAGEKVIVEGIQKVKAGMQVAAKPWIPPRRDRPLRRSKRNPLSIRKHRLAMASFFVNRPIVAIVISIIMTIVGVATFHQYLVAQFPNIVPPEIRVKTTYTGADALTQSNNRSRHPSNSR